MIAAQMARELVICWLGRHRRDAWEGLCGRYRERIERMAPIRDLPVVVRGAAGSDADRLELEGRAATNALPEPCWTVALDRRGKARSSQALSRWLVDLRERWPHPVAFVVGTDLGLSSSFVAQANERLSLGPLTLPHELARLVLYEQLYRALTIEAGIKYHRRPL